MKRFEISIGTEGNSDIVNLSPELSRRVKDIKGDALLHLFVAGSTASLTTMEFEPGLARHDFPNALQRLAPDDIHYNHEATWNDDNGHSHVRASLIGPGLTVPFSNGKLLTGEYQQVVLIDFDTRPRRRTVIASARV